MLLLLTTAASSSDAALSLLLLLLSLLPLPVYSCRPRSRSFHGRFLFVFLPLRDAYDDGSRRLSDELAAAASSFSRSGDMGGKVTSLKMGRARLCAPAWLLRAWFLGAWPLGDGLRLGDWLLGDWLRLSGGLLDDWLLDAWLLGDWLRLGDWLLDDWLLLCEWLRLGGWLVVSRPRTASRRRCGFRFMPKPAYEYERLPSSRSLSSEASTLAPCTSSNEHHAVTMRHNMPCPQDATYHDYDMRHAMLMRCGEPCLHDAAYHAYAMRRTG
jgi:hypothetical protein